MEFTYKEIPKEISQIIFDDTDMHTFLVINDNICGEIDLLTLLTKILCDCKERIKKRNISAFDAFCECTFDIYYYIDTRWDQKPINFKRRELQNCFRSLFLGKPIDIHIDMLVWTKHYFYQKYENETINHDFLELMCEALKASEQQEKDIISKTQDMFTLFNYMLLNQAMVNNINLLKQRLSIEGVNDIFLKEVAIYNQGYVEGIRKERARKRGNDI